MHDVCVKLVAAAHSVRGRSSMVAGGGRCDVGKPAP